MNVDRLYRHPFVRVEEKTVPPKRKNQRHASSYHCCRDNKRTHAFHVALAEMKCVGLFPANPKPKSFTSKPRLEPLAVPEWPPPTADHPISLVPFTWQATEVFGKVRPIVLQCRGSHTLFTHGNRVAVRPIIL